MIFGKPERPQVCLNFAPSVETCGKCNDDAHYYLSELEKATKPYVRGIAI
jgi:hypothetical protein